MLKNRKLVFGAVLVFAAIGVLSVRAFAGSATYYYEVAELVRMGDSGYDRTVKVRGIVDEGSMTRDAQGTTLRFVLTDEGQTDKLSVVYRGVVPDTFKEGAEVVCEGSRSNDGVFRASVLMPKCPSRYTAAPG